MTATPWPASPAWLHEGARSGFEVVYFQPVGDGFRIEGRVVAIEDAEPWIVDYDIVVDGAFRTRAATVSSRTAQRIRSAMLTADGHGRWRIDGSSAPQLDGCLDIDLEASAFTNALPVRRLTLGDGQKAASPAAYVRATDASVVRLEQTYTRAISTEAGQRYDYQAPTFGFSCELSYDRYGLVIDYPGLAERAG